MRAATLVQQHPPTPPTADQELQYGLQHLVRHNAEQQYLQSNHSPMMHNSQYAAARYPDPSESHVAGLGLTYANFGEPGPTYYPEEGLSGVPEYTQQNAMRSPPTPRSTNESEAGRRTRSGRSATRTVSPSVGSTPDLGVKAPAKVRKSRASKSDKPKTVPKLTAPLSILTRNFKEPVRDMEAWVHRSAEVRQQEAEKRNGYITRPMNSFMLYRSAFAERTKQWCLQNNHQVVSSVSGQSWPMEPQEVRDQYNEYAKIERHNHQMAHPDYKFSPSKAGNVPKKRKGEYSDEEESLGNSDFDDGDAEWGTAGQRRSGKGRKPKPLREELYSHADFNASVFGMHTTHMNGRPFWEQREVGKPLPSMVPAGSYDGYYPGTGYQTMGMQQTDALHLQNMEHNSMYHNSTQALLGLPGGHNHELFQANSRTATPATHESHVDPMLMGMEYDPSRFGDNTEYGQDPAMAQMQGHGLFGDDISPAHLADHEYKPHAWEHDLSLLAVDHETEFSKWM